MTTETKTPDWSRVPEGVTIRVSRFADDDGTAWSAGAWQTVQVGRHAEDREIATAWGATPDEAIAAVIENIG